jgi:hypothetical protein
MPHGGGPAPLGEGLGISLCTKLQVADLIE